MTVSDFVHVINEQNLTEWGGHFSEFRVSKLISEPPPKEVEARVKNVAVPKVKQVDIAKAFLQEYYSHHLHMARRSVYHTTPFQHTS